MQTEGMKKFKSLSFRHLWLFLAGLFISLLANTGAIAQPAPDSLAKIDSVRIDTAELVWPIKDTIRPVLKFPFTSDSFLYHNRLFFSFTNPVRYTISKKPWQGSEAIFYSIIVLLLVRRKLTANH